MANSSSQRSGSSGKKRSSTNQSSSSKAGNRGGRASSPNSKASAGSGKTRSSGKRAGSGKTGSSGSGRSGSSGKSAGSGKSGKAASGRYGQKSYGQKSYGKKSSRSGGQRGQPGTSQTKDKRRDLKGAAVNLPGWVVEELTRVTPKQRVAPALEALGEGAAAFSEGRYHQAMKWAEQAKGLASRDATTRELLGLSAYRVGDWSTALRELRTYRRFAGETTHMPVEMDCLRAMGRRDDVAAVWDELQSRGARPGVFKEGCVVFASMLIDEGDLTGARDLVGPRTLKADPFPEDLRMWYVAARAAALDGDTDEARRLRNAILTADPGFPGIDELESLIAAA
jgi:hypothetical protein